MKIQKATTLNATYLSVLLESCKEHELCFFNSTLPSRDEKEQKKRPSVKNKRIAKVRKKSRTTEPDRKAKYPYA